MENARCPDHLLKSNDASDFPTTCVSSSVQPIPVNYWLDHIRESICGHDDPDGFDELWNKESGAEDSDDFGLLVRHQVHRSETGSSKTDGRSWRLSTSLARQLPPKRDSLVRIQDGEPSLPDVSRKRAPSEYSEQEPAAFTSIPCSDVAVDFRNGFEPRPRHKTRKDRYATKMFQDDTGDGSSDKPKADRCVDRKSRRKKRLRSAKEVVNNFTSGSICKDNLIMMKPRTTEDHAWKNKQGDANRVSDLTYNDFDLGDAAHRPCLSGTDLQGFKDGPGSLVRPSQNPNSDPEIIGADDDGNACPGRCVSTYYHHGSQHKTYSPPFGMRARRLCQDGRPTEREASQILPQTVEYLHESHHQLPQSLEHLADSRNVHGFTPWMSDAAGESECNHRAARSHDYAFGRAWSRSLRKSERSGTWEWPHQSTQNIASPSNRAQHRTEHIPSSDAFRPLKRKLPNRVPVRCSSYRNDLALGRHSYNSNASTVRSSIKPGLPLHAQDVSSVGEQRLPFTNKRLVSSNECFLGSRTIMALDTAPLRAPNLQVGLKDGLCVDLERLRSRSLFLHERSSPREVLVIQRQFPELYVPSVSPTHLKQQVFSTWDMAHNVNNMEYFDDALKRRFVGNQTDSFK